MTWKKTLELRNDEARHFAYAVGLVVALVITVLISSASAQRAEERSPTQSTPAARSYPKEIRGYKLERAKVEIKKQKDSKTEDASEKASRDADALIQFGDPTIVRMTPLGITLEVPVTVAAVKQKGHVDFLMFEDMVVNGIPVTVEDYNYQFDLPTNKPTLLPKPVRLFISTPRALLGALGEWGDAKDLWPVIGRVYVFGQFKKFIFKFKRVVPVELTLSLRNPLLPKKVDGKPKEK